MIQIPSIPILVSVLFPFLHFRIKVLILVTYALYTCTVQVIKKCPDVLSVRTYSTRQKKVSGKVHGRDGEASCPTRTTTQRFYRPMPLLSLYLVLSLSSSSFSLDRQLCADTRVYVGRARSTVEVHGRDGEASCST